MAREITHEATGPLKLDESDLDEEKGDVAVCLCGLSGEYPFCDGSHRATEDEEDGAVYKYEGDDAVYKYEEDGGVYKYEGDDADGERREIEAIVFADE